MDAASEEYLTAAEEYATTEGIKQIEELKKKLNGIKEDIEKHSDYYNDTYLAEVLNAIRMLDEADLEGLSGRKIMELVNHAKAVVDKQASSYSSKLNDLAADAAGLVNAANEWWAFLPEAMKGQSPYIEAIRLTNDLSRGLVGITGSLNDVTRSFAGSGTVYDLDKLTKAYEAFATDFQEDGGTIQGAAKAAAQYVYDSAEKVYNEEAKKKHTANVLQAYRTAIDNLKTGIEAWDYDGTRADAAAVKTAETNLLNDRPAQEGDEKPNDRPAQEDGKKPNGSQTKEAENKTRETGPKTGDDADPVGTGLLGLLSMISMTGILKLRRKN